MSNRHQRRSSVARFRREASGMPLTTYLVEAGVNLDRHATLRDAITFWENNRARRRPMCLGCKVRFGDDATEPAAYLFATSPSQPGTASVSVFCADCWRELPPNELERNCVRILRQLLPGGRLAPLKGASP